MDFWTILIIAGFCLCAFIVVRQIIMIVKFVRSCSEEGVIAAKFNFNIGSAFLIAATIVVIVLVGYHFGNAAEEYKNIKFNEEMKSDEFIEYFTELQEEKEGIIILNPEQYYLENLENAKSSAKSDTISCIAFVFLSIYGILSLFAMFCVITNKGFRNYKTKDAIPIFAEYYKYTGKIFIKCKDITGKPAALTHFKANSKNLASLGQFIVREEQTIQEETI